MYSRTLRSLLLLILALVLLGACIPMPETGVSPAATVIPAVKAQPTARVIPTATAPATTAAQMSPVKHLTILYTNDEHGWLEAQKSKTGQTGGVAEMLGHWEKDEGLPPADQRTPDSPFLVLSGGDMWTGPAISTWFSGDSAAEAMNLMGYQAAAIGNHDFDFGLDVLRRHAQESSFPFLTANVVNKGTTDTPDFARPYAIVEAGGVKVGVIGLTTLATPRTTSAKNIAGFDFLPYADALTRYVPQVRAAGADLVVVIAHVCGAEMRALAPEAKQLGVDVLTAGHCHERIADEVDGLPLLGGGSYWQAYAKLRVEIDTAAHRVTTGKPQVVPNTAGPNGGPVDATLAGRVAYWQAEADKDLGEVVGYTRDGLAPRSNALLNLVADSWLAENPDAQVAVTNLGSFRQGIDAGPITLGDIMNVLPFNDQIVEVAVTGAQLKQNLDCCGGVVGGITYRGGKLLLADGTPVDPKQTYHVLINDFMADGGDNYKFALQDPNAYYTAIDWRQPLIDYLKGLNTSPQAPLESHLDTVKRTDR